MKSRLVLVCLLAATAVTAQVRAPVIGPFGVLHGASLQPVAFFGDPEFPAGIAPGSILILKGAYLGPDEITVGVAPFGLRLPDQPGGTEVHVRSLASGVVMQARILHAWTFQVAALLPEGFPLGEAEAQVWYEGRASEPSTFRVVRSLPALFTLDQSGSGRGIIQNYEGPADLPLNALTRPARPGQTVILWGTGLGDVEPGELDVFVGGQTASFAYAGPAPGLPGVDQYNLRLPDDFSAFGCSLPVGVSSGIVSSGQVSIAITPDGGPCEHPWGLTPARMAELEAGDRGAWIRVSLSDGVSDTDTPQPVPSSSGSVATAFPLSFNIHGLESATQQSAFLNNIIPPSRRTCGLANTIGAIFGDFVPGPVEPLPEPPPPENPAVSAADAGQPWRLTGPGGRAAELTRQPFGNVLGPASFDPGFFGPGEWTLAIPGGSDVPAFETAVRMPTLPEMDVPPAIRRGEELALTWSTASVEAGVEASVWLTAWVPAPQSGQRQQIGLNCPVDPSAGQITLALDNLGDRLDEADSVELTFRVVSRRNPAIPGVDRIDLEGAAFRTWTVPLE